MKTIFKQISVIVAAMVTLASTANAQTSEWAVKSYMEDLGWEHTGQTREAYLTEGQSTSAWFRTYYSGVEYAAVAFSEEAGVFDLDVQTVYYSGREHLADTDESSLAMITFSPYSTTTLGIKMTNYSSSGAWTPYKCKFMLFYR